MLQGFVSQRKEAMNSTIKDNDPDRNHLGPTGPAKMPPDSKRGPDVKRVHPGNVNPGDGPIVGPTPTDAPHGGARKQGRNR